MAEKPADRKLIRFIIILIILNLIAIVLLSLRDYAVEKENDIPAVTETVSPSEAPEEPQPEAVPESATLMFGGDVLFHESVFSQAKTGRITYDFRPYFQLFKDVFTADYNCINLETPIDSFGDNDNICGYPCFNAPHEILDGIKEMNIQLCSNSNNHTLDTGYRGLVITKNFIKEAGFDTLGTYTSPEEHDAMFIKVINGIKIGFCAFTQSTNGNILRDELEAYAVDRMRESADEACEDILPRVRALRSAGAEAVVVILHWGTEYDTEPSEHQLRTAQLLCEGGADIIIGSHSHVVQPIEMLKVTRADGSQKKCLVVYSLGNLFCNQNTNKTQTQRGMVTAVRFTRDDSGKVVLSDAFYMPTLLYKTGGKGADFIRLVPAGCCMGGNAPEMPDPEDFEDCCSFAYENVVAAAGDAIPAVTDPAHYPEGFFA